MVGKPGLNLHDPLKTLRNDGDPPQHAAKGEWPTLRDEGPAGVHVSIDGGSTWTIANEGLPVTSMYKVTVQNGYVFVISDKSLLFRRPMSELVAAAKAGLK